MSPSFHGAMPARTALIGTVGRVVIAMRLGIAVVALTWLLTGRPLWFAVGTVSVVLSLCFSAVVEDPALRAAISLCVTALLFAHIVFGMQAGLYETSAVYDKMMHLLGCSAIAGIVGWSASGYCKRRRVQLPTALLWALAVGIVISLGTLWEVFEFAIDRTGLFRTQKGLTDTMLDLIADALGALATAGACIWMKRRSAATMLKGTFS